MDAKMIGRFRKSLKLTQHEFAQRLGVSRAAVAKWEAGVYKPSSLAKREIERLRMISRSLITTSKGRKK